MVEYRENERAWLAAIIESSDDAIIAKDLLGIVTGWNTAAERMFGYTSAEMLGTPLATIFPASRFDEEGMILARIRSGEHIEHYETERRHKDGRIFPVSVTVSPIRDAHGTLVGASNTTHDLSERAAHELRVQTLQAELAHVQRLTELGQFVSALAHEVNQPLTAMTNYLNACHHLIAAGDLAGLVGAITRIGDQRRRTTEIVRRISNFVRKRDLRLQEENLADLVDETIELTRNTARGEDFEVSTAVHPSVAVHVDKVQFQQVLFNLLRNGIEATHGQMRREINVSASLSSDQVVEVRVSDSGPGLSEDVKAKLFQPFVTTKPNGMGIGLSVCRTIIEAHGGQLWANTSAHGGAVFYFTLTGALIAQSSPIQDAPD
jgi:two-component system, LuxR family, sensor kinase FixL